MRRVVGLALVAMTMACGYARAEVEGALHDAGLEALACYASFTLVEPAARSDRFHFVARRGG